MRTFVIEGNHPQRATFGYLLKKDLLEMEGADLKPTPVPHRPPSARGGCSCFPVLDCAPLSAVRRATSCAKRVIGLTGNAKPFSLDQHYFLTLGGIKGSGKLERGSVAMMAAFRSGNPLISMFGAG